MNLTGYCRNASSYFVDGYNKIVNGVKNTYHRVITTTQDLTRNSNSCYNLSMITLGSLVGAGISFVFGLGISYFATKLFPQLLNRMIFNILFAIPAGGIIGSNLTSYYLRKACNAKDDNKFKNTLETSVVALGSVTTASLVTTFGIGMLQLSSAFFPK